ncbi:MAG TPA: hypothetical protein VIR01_11415, partial [Pyrinomonadaceae bacterium]
MTLDIRTHKPTLLSDFRQPLTNFVAPLHAPINLIRETREIFTVWPLDGCNSWVFCFLTIRDRPGQIMTFPFIANA